MYLLCCPVFIDNLDSVSSFIYRSKFHSFEETFLFVFAHLWFPEFRKTDRSLLVSPEGSSRVPFDPQQKPLFGVLKSPVASLTNSTKKKTKSIPKASPKRPTLLLTFSSRPWGDWWDRGHFILQEKFWLFGKTWQGGQIRNGLTPRLSICQLGLKFDWQVERLDWQAAMWIITHKWRRVDLFNDVGQTVPRIAVVIILCPRYRRVEQPALIRGL